MPLPCGDRGDRGDRGFCLGKFLCFVVFLLCAFYFTFLFNYQEGELWEILRTEFIRRGEACKGLVSKDTTFLPPTGCHDNNRDNMAKHVG